MPLPECDLAWLVLMRQRLGSFGGAPRAVESIAACGRRPMVKYWSKEERKQVWLPAPAVEQDNPFSEGY